MRGIDEDAQRALNAQAPQIENLGGRVLKLFAPYKAKIVATCLIVVVSAALGVIPPLLVKRIFDQALFPVDGDASMSLLIRLVVGMVGLYLLSAALNVVQTWLTSTVGNSVTGDLRVRLFEHLQAMELAFFTRTKTGVIQSRLQNDVGGVSGVLTSTLTSILGNAVTVIAWGNGTGEAGYGLLNVLASADPSKGQGSSNWGRYSNPQVDKDLELSSAEFDDAKREAILRDSVQRVSDDVGILPLFHYQNIWAARNGLRVEPLVSDRTTAAMVTEEK